MSVTISFDKGGVQPVMKEANLTVLTNPGGDPYAVNDSHTGGNIVNATSSIIRAGENGVFEFSLPELSVAVSGH